MLSPPIACPKDGPRWAEQEGARNQAARSERKEKTATRQKGTHCWVCKVKPHESVHEVKFKSRGGKAVQDNQIATCGSGTTGCHGACQRHWIKPYRKRSGQWGFTLAAGVVWDRERQDWRRPLGTQRVT